MFSKVRLCIAALSTSVALASSASPSEARSIIISHGNGAIVTDTANVTFKFETNRRYLFAFVFVHDDQFLKRRCALPSDPNATINAWRQAAQVHAGAAEVNFDGFLASLGLRKCASL